MLVHIGREGVSAGTSSSWSITFYPHPRTRALNQREAEQHMEPGYKTPIKKLKPSRADILMSQLSRKEEYLALI